ncbi:MAG TPA: aminotransferase class V-fold PLP-dependent enzyme [Solirubrobacteraceae bacterium]|nr:aminotransferase class V-fold PLP-dependent enzyme [Solirubrobacteraceae bacterium]
MDAASLRAEFPVLARVTYLNAGTDGPVPARALAAVEAELRREADEGRHFPHFKRRAELKARQREGYAALLGADPSDVAITTCTSEGIARALLGMQLGPGDEVLTSDEEHPGVLGPLGAARARCGVTIRVAPFAELANAVGPNTRLVACSHVSWVSGRIAPTELAGLDGVVLMMDGAQGVGAVPVDVRALGCHVYAGSGQKWLCGPDGSGMLYVAPEFRDRLAMPDPGYGSFVDAMAGLDAELHADARRYDAPALPAEASAFALAGLEVLGEAGWEAVHDRGAHLAAQLAEGLADRGLRVLRRDRTTLVAFEVPDPVAQRDALRDAGVVVRDLPGRGALRASVGAWNDEADLERLLDLVTR